MQRSCADVNSPCNENAELTQRALLLIQYFEAGKGTESTPRVPKSSSISLGLSTGV
jgi:hypothetical protein